MNIEEDLIETEEAAKILRQTARTLTVWRCESKGPRYLKIGRRVFYRMSWLRDFIAGSEVTA